MWLFLELHACYSSLVRRIHGRAAELSAAVTHSLAAALELP